MPRVHWKGEVGSSGKQCRSRWDHGRGQLQLEVAKHAGCRGVACFRGVACCGGAVRFIPRDVVRWKM